jgi:Ca2+/H+ antiporter, TMEM165/GDT1 family
MNPWIVAATTFLASALEFVEAATIVLAVAYTAGLAVALRATAWATLILVVIAAVLGPALALYVPLGVLQIIIGIFLILFGYTWLRKAIWRYAGRKAMRDEQAMFAAEVAELQRHEQRFAFATAFNGVLLEGLEVVIIVITFSTGRAGAFLWAASGALVAAAIVAGAAAILRHPFSRIPENAMGCIVGIMLLSFGTFWSGEGLGVRWWAGETTLAWIVVLYAITTLALIAAWQRRTATS